MRKECPICKKSVEEDVSKICQDAEDWIIKAIRRSHPDWVEKNGTCSKCVDYYKKQGPSGCK
ncbi:MAG TPA: hypothetical protein DCL35_03185 [Candidatus Omnitrophica bacterium]|nr:hypothetical protein [Candidatus Omnitrophota bacterium]